MTSPVVSNIPLLNDLTVPDTFATDATGFVHVDGVVSITLEALRADHSSNPARAGRVVTGRVVLPVPAAQRLALGLLEFLKANGFDPMPAIGAEATARQERRRKSHH